MSTILYNARPVVRPGRAFNSLLTEMLREALPAQPQPSASFVPAADVLETAEGYELHLALPGVAKDAVKIDFEKGQLVVSGSRPAPAAEGENAPKLHRLETRFGDFRRVFRLPDTVRVAGISAEMSDGLLRIALPFDTEKTSVQHIEVR